MSSLADSQTQHLLTLQMPLLSTNVYLYPENEQYSSATDKIYSRQQMDRQTESGKENDEDNWLMTLSRRLNQRKYYFRLLTAISKYMCISGCSGIILMIIINEIIFNDHQTQYKKFIWFLQFIITVTTTILLILIVCYHYCELKFNAADKAVNHWRLGLTKRRKLLILFELLICAIHPIPWYLPFDLDLPFFSGNIMSVSSVMFYSLPMFGRLYLISRFIMFRSHLVQSVLSQSMGCLNQVSIDFTFLIKTYLDQWPVRVIFMFCGLFFMISSWLLRACNYNLEGKHFSFSDSMWMFVVTYTTVGYGDLVPTTLCGRCVAAMTSIIGVFSTALLISVLAQKLQLSRTEKYFHNFDLNLHWEKERRRLAAIIIFYALRIWQMKKKSMQKSRYFLRFQAKLIYFVQASKSLRQAQRTLMDNCVGIPDIIKLQRDVANKTENNDQCLKDMESRIAHIEEKLSDINQNISQLQNTLELLLINSAQTQRTSISKNKDEPDNQSIKSQGSVMRF